MSRPRRMIAFFFAPVFIVGLLLASASPAAPMDDNWVYIGTYTRPNKSEGIYLLHVDPKSGELSQPTLVAKTTSPSFLAIHPNHQYLYCVNEVSDFGGKKSGAVSTFSIDSKSGMLTMLNNQPSGGEGPCYVALDHTGKVGIVANYNSGSVASFPVGDDGKLKEAATVDQHMGKGPNRQRQEGPHAHCFDMDPANKFAISADLGLDKLFVYKLDLSSGKLTPNDPPAGILPPGSGPRHVAFSKDARFIYAINEVRSTITAFQYDAAKGSMKELQTITTLPADFHGNSTTAEIIIHPSGKFLYGSNRGHDSLAIFSIDASSGKLMPAGHQSTQGKTPRGFNIHPSGNVLIAGNQDTDNVVSYQIDQNTGALKPTSSNIKIGSPVHVMYLIK